jgi:hypothetical protein
MRSRLRSVRFKRTAIREGGETSSDVIFRLVEVEAKERAAERVGESHHHLPQDIPGP